MTIFIEGALPFSQERFQGGSCFALLGLLLMLLVCDFSSHVSCTFHVSFCLGGMGSIRHPVCPLPTFKKIWGKYSCFTVRCSFLLYRQQSESSMCIRVSPLCFWISFPFRSPQSTKQSPLCCAAGSD